MSEGGKDLRCCGQFVRWVTFIMNVLTLLAGGAIVGVGAWMLADQMYMGELIGSKLYKASAGMIIACGGFGFLLSIFGCIGACTKSKCMLSVQFSCLTSVFVILVVAGILAFVFLGQNLTKDKVEGNMRDSLKNYNDDDNVKKSWDETQEKLECCGVEDYADWRGDVPESCCKDEKKCSSLNDYYSKGCYDAMEEELEKNSKVIGGIGLAVAGILIVSSIFTCALSREL